MGTPALKHNEKFAWEQYRQWPDDERWELIGGEAFAMTPSPGVRHQNVSGRLFSRFERFFEGGKCRPFTAPLDVKLSNTDVVQPDLLVVCDPKQITETHIEGAPKLAVEIISPSSESHDRLKKMKLYEKFGVAEYWIVTTYPPLIEIYALDDSGRFRLYSGGTLGDTIESPAFSGLEIKLDDVFDIPYTEDEMRIFRVKEPPAKYESNGARNRG